jgi:predicted LPLAT superfamily acyltransferase
MAHALGVPIILGFGVYHGGNRYTAHFELFAEHLRLPRDSREAAITEAAQKYAHRLEQYVRNAPYNWFNFYDYWQPEIPGDHESAAR